MIRGMLREAYWRRRAEDGGDVVANLSALCPACGFEHSFRVDFEGHGQHGKDVWTFNGDYDKPTFSPSMGANLHRSQEHYPICHSFLRDGVWQFLGDCTHAMAGQHVPMIPPEPDATFQKRHGWHLFPWTDDEGKPREDN